MFLKDTYIKIIIIVTVFVILIMGGIHLYLRNNPTLPLSSRPYLIKKVIDGDTLIIENGERIRLIGIDAPETHHPVISAQRFGQESADFLKKMVENHKCMLEYEPDRVRDSYERILAYVYVNGNLINAEMIKMGYAYVYTRFPFKKMEEFIVLEKQARDKKIGLWEK
ncbi:MAG: thermonuclease family protein [Candidatus Firestonebacteria bacterium]